MTSSDLVFVFKEMVQSDMERILIFAFSELLAVLRRFVKRFVSKIIQNSQKAPMREFTLCFPF